MNKTIKKKVNCINSSQNKGLSLYPSTDLAQFHGSTVFGFSALTQLTQFLSRISNVFGLSTNLET
jgi:hypothetical protein